MLSKILSCYTDLIESSCAAEIRRSLSHEAKEKGWPGTYWLKSVIMEKQGYEHYLHINLATWSKQEFLTLECIETLTQKLEACYYAVNVPQLTQPLENYKNYKKK